MNRAAVAALTVVAFLGRWFRFQETAHPLGTDGYYYVVQTADLVGLGRLHVPDSSWVFLLHGAIGQLVEPVQTTKVVACLLAASVVPAAYFAGRAHGSTAAWVLALWAAGSPVLTHLAADFPKNLGVVPAWFVLLGLLGGEGTARWLGIVVAGALMATAHRTGAVFLVVALLGGLVGQVLGGRALFRGALGLAGMLVAYGLLATVVPGWLVWGDHFRLSNQFAFGGIVPFAYFGRAPLGSPERVELALVWVALLVGMWRLRQRPTPTVFLAGAGLLVCVLPIYRTDQLDLGYRLLLLAPIFAAPLMAMGVQIADQARRPLVALAVVVGIFTARSGVDLALLPPYDRFEQLIAAIPRPLPQLLIAHQGVNFLYDHQTGEEAMAWAPEPELPREAIGRIVWGVRASEWASRFEGRRVRLDERYSYVGEADWERFVRSAEEHGDEDLRGRLADWRNPRAVRPAALTRGRPDGRGRR